VPRNPSSYPEVVAAAVRDLAEHGFDNMGRVEHWTQQIKEAAERQAGSPQVREQMLRDALGAIYRRLVERGQIDRWHPGVARFTLERVRPALRAELDRRIMASASLIRLNREESIERTLRRFQGWATSIPPGGSGDPKSAKARADIKKALAQLPFEERRVIVDQGHKLTAALSSTVATAGGAIAARWHSHWRQSGYDYREDHRERDTHVYAIRGNWALAQGLMRAGPAGYTDDVTTPGEEVFCRCYHTYIYNLRDLPPEMVTRRGEAKLAEVRASINAMRADNVGAVA